MSVIGCRDCFYVCLDHPAKSHKKQIRSQDQIGGFWKQPLIQWRPRCYNTNWPRHHFVAIFFNLLLTIFFTGVMMLNEMHSSDVIIIHSLVHHDWFMVMSCVWQCTVQNFTSLHASIFSIVNLNFLHLGTNEVGCWVVNE